MRRAVALVAAAVVLGACGSSKEDDANAQVCDAKADIQKQAKTLSELTPSTISADAVRTPLAAIGDDLKTIQKAESELSDDRRAEVKTAANDLTSSMTQIATDVVTSFSTAGAKQELQTSVTKFTSAVSGVVSEIGCD